MLQPGDVLAEKYRLVRVIGEGGMGAVFEAHHEVIGKRLAIKTLKPHLVASSEAVGRFTREAKAAAAIRHPSIIDIHDLGTAPDGSLYIVMEFLEGNSLGDLLERDGTVAPDFAAYVACQVLSALDAAHGKGIIHRDIKPDNVFLVDKGLSLPEVKLLDFGISKIADRNDPNLRMTQTGEVLGTPYYMSPEQARGAADLDHRLDVYAMGVVLYEALTGERPFKANNFLALVASVATDTPELPTALNPNLPPGLEAVILTAMARDPAARYATAALMLEALLPFVDEHARGHLALAKLSGTHLAASAPRAPGAASGSSASRPAQVVSGTNMAWQSGVAAPPGRPRRSRALLVAALALLALVVGGSIVALWLAIGRGDGAGAPAPPGVRVASGEPGSARNAGSRAEDQPAIVTVSLEGLPDDVQVFLDGAAVEGRELRHPVSDDDHEVRVVLGDRELWRGTVRFDRDRILAAPMVRPLAPDAGATAAAPPADAGATAATPPADAGASAATPPPDVGPSAPASRDRPPRRGTSTRGTNRGNIGRVFE